MFYFHMDVCASSSLLNLARRTHQASYRGEKEERKSTLLVKGNLTLPALSEELWDCFLLRQY